jgi:hypothetical protein
VAKMSIKTFFFMSGSFFALFAAIPDFFRIAKGFLTFSFLE